MNSFGIRILDDKWKSLKKDNIVKIEWKTMNID